MNADKLLFLQSALIRVHRRPYRFSEGIFDRMTIVVRGTACVSRRTVGIHEDSIDRPVGDFRPGLSRGYLRLRSKACHLLLVRCPTVRRLSYRNADGGRSNSRRCRRAQRVACSGISQKRRRFSGSRIFEISRDVFRRPSERSNGLTRRSFGPVPGPHRHRGWSCPSIWDCGLR